VWGDHAGEKNGHPIAIRANQDFFWCRAVAGPISFTETRHFREGWYFALLFLCFLCHLRVEGEKLPLISAGWFDRITAARDVT